MAWGPAVAAAADPGVERGCATACSPSNRPFGIAGESFENPQYLDRMIETVGAEPASGYEQKVTSCGGALAFSEPDKSQKQIRDLVESAYDHGAEMIVTPCQLCQANVEIYQSQINRKGGTSSSQKNSGKLPRGRNGQHISLTASTFIELPSVLMS